MTFTNKKIELTEFQILNWMCSLFLKCFIMMDFTFQVARRGQNGGGVNTENMNWGSAGCTEEILSKYGCLQQRDIQCEHLLSKHPVGPIRHGFTR